MCVSFLSIFGLLWLLFQNFVNKVLSMHSHPWIVYYSKNLKQLEIQISTQISPFFQWKINQLAFFVFKKKIQNFCWCCFFGSHRQLFALIIKIPMHIKRFFTQKINDISFGFIGRSFVTNQLSYIGAVGCPSIHPAMLMNLNMLELS